MQSHPCPEATVVIISPTDGEIIGSYLQVGMGVGSLERGGGEVVAMVRVRRQAWRWLTISCLIVVCSSFSRAGLCSL